MTLTKMKMMKSNDFLQATDILQKSTLVAIYSADDQLRRHALKKSLEDHFKRLKKQFCDFRYLFPSSSKQKSNNAFVTSETVILLLLFCYIACIFTKRHSIAIAVL